VNDCKPLAWGTDICRHFEFDSRDTVVGYSSAFTSLVTILVSGKGLHSSTFPLNLSSLRPFPLNLSLLCPLCNPT